MTKSNAQNKNISQISKSTLARSDDGSIQITFTIAWNIIEKSRNEAISELGKDVEIPGFRKGNAPYEKVLENIPKNTLVEKTLSGILPRLFTDAIKEHKIKPAIYPKFEVLKTTENEDWQVRAVTAEIPKIDMSDYKKLISEEGKSKKIWTPGTNDDPKGEKEEKEASRQEKEQQVIKLLLGNIKIDIPKVIIDEEVNSRLSQLLVRIEKLGLTLESYLASLSKNAEQLRKEYENQAINALRLDLILNEIAKKENIKVEKSQIEASIKAGSADPKMAEKLDTPEQRRVIKSVLLRRAALDSLVSLI